MVCWTAGYADEQGPDRRILPLVLKHVVVSLMLAPDGRANARYWRIRAELPLAHNGARFGGKYDEMHQRTENQLHIAQQLSCDSGR